MHKLTVATNHILRILKENKVAAKYISSLRTSKSSIRETGSGNYKKLAILGYQLRKSFSIELVNLNNYPKITNALLNVDNVVDISTKFDVGNRKQIESELLIEAGLEVKIKAKQMASALNVNIGRVFAIKETESTAFSSYYATFGLRQANRMSFDLGGIIVPGKIDFIPKHIELSKGLHAVYKLDF